MKKYFTKTSPFILSVLSFSFLFGISESYANNFNYTQSYLVSSLQEDMNLSPLMNAALQGNSEAASILISSGVDVNQQNLGGATALHLSSRANHFDTTNVLLRNDADVSIKDNSGFTPLMRASISGNPYIVKLLVDNSDTNVVWMKNKQKQTALVHTAMSNCMECAEFILRNGEYTEKQKKVVENSIVDSIKILEKKNNPEFIALLNEYLGKLTEESKKFEIEYKMMDLKEPKKPIAQKTTDKKTPMKKKRKVIIYTFSGDKRHLENYDKDCIYIGIDDPEKARQEKKKIEAIRPEKVEPIKKKEHKKAKKIIKPTKKKDVKKIEKKKTKECLEESNKAVVVEEINKKEPKKETKKVESKKEKIKKVQKKEEIKKIEEEPKKTFNFSGKTIDKKVLDKNIKALEEEEKMAEEAEKAAEKAAEEMRKKAEQEAEKAAEEARKEAERIAEEEAKEAAKEAARKMEELKKQEELKKSEELTAKNLKELSEKNNIKEAKEVKKLAKNKNSEKRVEKIQKDEVIIVKDLNKEVASKEVKEETKQSKEASIKYSFSGQRKTIREALKPVQKKKTFFVISNGKNAVKKEIENNNKKIFYSLTKPY